MKRTSTIASVAAAIALVLGFFAWSANEANAFGDWGEFDYYRLLVRGYRSGHLHLDKQPPAELLALADPYDPAQNGPYRLPDASYYKGHYYLYFGAAPAATVMLPFTLLTGREMTTGTAVLVFTATAFLALAGLWLAVRARYFPRSAWWIAPLGIVGLGSSTHMLTLLRRPMWWELPIAAGIAFTLLALVAVYRAIHGTRPVAAMASAGLCLGLAVASRPTCLLAAPLLLAPLWWWRPPPAGSAKLAPSGRPAPWRLAVAAAVPLAICGLAIMGYNYARFENPFEFGQNYQLSGAYESQLEHFRLRYLPHNVAVLFFQPLRWTWEFPFVMAWGDPVDIPGYYGTEEVSGLFVTFPFLCLALAVPLAWRGREPEEARRLQVTIGAVAGYFLPVCAVFLCFFATTARYMADFASGLALLAGFGLLGIEHGIRVRERTRLGAIAWRAVVAPLVAGSIVLGAVVALLLSFDYHGRAPGRENPDRWDAIERAVSNAIGRTGLALGWYDGPRMLRVKFKPQPPGAVETLWHSAGDKPGERILIEHGEGPNLRFGYSRHPEATRWSAPLAWSPGRQHQVELQLPSLYRRPDGWAHGFRRNLLLRERSAVAVWFDGHRILATTAEPIAPDQTAGGAVGAGFTRAIVAHSKRLLRDDELPLNGAGIWAVAGPAPQPGQPAVALVTTGRKGNGNTLSLATVRPGIGRLGFEQEGQPAHASPEFALPATAALTVEIELAPVWPWSAAANEEQPLSVWLNGRLVWETRVRLHASAADEVYLARNAVGATCCAPETPGWSPAPAWERGYGGTLRLRMVAADSVSLAGEPFIALGAYYGSDIVGLRGTGVPGEARVFFEHFGLPVQEGRPFALEPGRVHTAEITLPSFEPARFSDAAAGDVVVRINREEVLRVHSECYATGDTTSNMGRNRYGGKVCGPALRGWLLDWRWMGVMENAAAAKAAQ